MLKLVPKQVEKNGASKLSEVDSSQPHEFIDQLIAQIRYLHVQEVWDAQMQNLSDLVDFKNLKKQKKHLRAL